MQIAARVRRWAQLRSRRSTPEFDVVVGLNFYWPHVSGLSEVARNVAEHLAASGLRVRVVTARFRPDLPAFEVHAGVEIERTRVLLSVRNGVLSPALPIVLARRIRQASIGHLHLPMLEAGLVAMATRARSIIVTYHCDYQTERDITGLIIGRSIDTSSRVAMRQAVAVVATSEDYAEHSRLYRSMRKKLTTVPPSFVPRDGGRDCYRSTDGLHVGALGRVAAEKGLDVLIRAFSTIEDPDARLLIAGDHSSVVARGVIDELRSAAAKDPRVSFLGFLQDEDVPDFFASLDVFAFPSVNPLEAFGIAQLEAMSAGLPVVASDLPGVRIPVLRTGNGILVPPGDVPALAMALVDPGLKKAPRGDRQVGDPQAPSAEYERLIRQIIG